MSIIKARNLRQSSTDAEKKLWAVLRHRRLSDYRFRRQHPIGAYIVDFACIKHRLIVEADGNQHLENEYDVKRTLWLEGKGWRVMRFWNVDVLRDTDVVLETILRELEKL